MKRLTIALLLAAAALTASPAAAGSWIFGPSYYSHQSTTGVRVGPRPQRSAPRYTRPAGEYVRAGYTRTYSAIRHRGRTLDEVHVVESWVQGGAQY